MNFMNASTEAKLSVYGALWLHSQLSRCTGSCVSA